MKLIKKICFSHFECVCQWRIQTLKDRKRLPPAYHPPAPAPPAYPNRDSWWGPGGKSSVSKKFSWLFESQLSLKKGGGKSPGSATVYICFLIYLYFFTAGNIAFCHKLKGKRKFLYCQTIRKPHNAFSGPTRTD